MNFNFSEVLTRAWQIVWKHKVLWIFGILAGCGRGGSNFNSGGDSGGGGNGGVANVPDLPPQLERVFDWIAGNVTTFVVIVITLACVITLITVFLGAIGRIGLIRGTAQADGGAESLIFGQLFSESMPYLWRVFGLSLLAGLPFFIVILMVILLGAVFAVGMSQTGDAGAVGIVGMLPVILGCFCILIPVGWVIGLIVRQSERSIVLEDSPVMPSLSRGWEIFRSNLGPIIVMAIILAVITLAVGFVIAIPLLIIVVPAVIAFAAGEGQSWNPLLFALICICLYAPVSWVLNGIAIAYAESAWTLTYMRLTRKPDSNDIVTPPTEQPPSMGDPDKTMISSSHA